VNVKTSFDKVDLLLVAPKNQNSSSLRQSLTDLDFRDIRTGSSIKDIEQSLETRPPDLLITDSDLADGDVCALIRDIRNHRIGTNPFMSIIVTTWKPSESLVHRVVESGADDLLVQPASRGQLRSRIDGLTFNRKPFIITARYIGPDRRNLTRSEKLAGMAVNVPNLLLAKASGDKDAAELQRAVDAAVASVNKNKLSRNAMHIGNLVKQVLAAYESKSIDGHLVDLLGNLIVTTEDATRRLTGTPFAAASKLCDALVKVAKRMEQSFRAPSQKDLRLLPQLAMSIHLALKDVNSNTTNKTAEDISDAVSRASSAALDRAVGE
jgi:DNA-binding response OmpR family regulator